MARELIKFQRNRHENILSTKYIYKYLCLSKYSVIHVLHAYAIWQYITYILQVCRPSIIISKHGNHFYRNVFKQAYEYFPLLETNRGNRNLSTPAVRVVFLTGGRRGIDSSPSVLIGNTRIIIDCLMVNNDDVLYEVPKWPAFLYGL